MFYKISNIGQLEQTGLVIFEVYDIDSKKSALFTVNRLLFTAVNKR